MQHAGGLGLIPSKRDWKAKLTFSPGTGFSGNGKQIHTSMLRGAVL